MNSFILFFVFFAYFYKILVWLKFDEFGFTNQLNSEKTN